jgi:hypothetical protein
LHDGNSHQTFRLFNYASLPREVEVEARARQSVDGLNIRL